MKNNMFTFLVGGKAGQGVKKAGGVAAALFSSMGRSVFQMDDYQSLIRGGHNFTVVSTSTEEISSHYMKADLLVNLDDRSGELHKDHLSSNGKMFHNSEEEEEGDGVSIPLASEAKDYPKPDLMLGVGAVAILAAHIGLEREELHELVSNEYPRGEEDNREYSGRIFDLAKQLIEETAELEKGKERGPLLYGNEAIALGAYAGGLNTYFAYPMTPASTILHYLAGHAKDMGIAVMHAESEIAVMNMAIGSAVAGARAMVGTSGGGFALMEEGYSLAGMAEVPLLCVLSSRPGPSTGVPTYTEQGDLRFALNQGHGEFPRLVASPGNMSEAFFLARDLMDLAWYFQTPAILLTEKHLSESRMNVHLDGDNNGGRGPKIHDQGEYYRYENTEDGVSPLLFPPSDEVIKWNSYEHDETGLTTEEGEQIYNMQGKRARKGESLEEHLKGMHTVNRFGDDGPPIYTYGSTVMSVLEALRYGNIDARVVQPVYLEPFPKWEFKGKRKGGLVVEQSSTGLFAAMLREKAGIKPDAIIMRYDGRPFEPTELAHHIKEMIE